VIGSLLLYRRRASPLHATRASVGAIWTGALVAATLTLYHPLALLALTLALFGAAYGAGVGASLARALRMAAIVAVPIVLVNVLVNREGLTVFARLGDLGPFGQGDLTVEALVYGAVIALKVTLLILITSLASLAIDPDEMLRGFRRLSFHSVLTATLATRMLPVLAADAQRLAEAQRTRPGGGAHGARGRVALLSAVVAGSLDRAMDVAATLEVRGYAVAGHARARDAQPTSAGRRGTRNAGSRVRGFLRARTHSPRAPLSRHDLAFASSVVAVLALALAGRLTGVAAFTAYPRVELRLDAASLALCAALIAAVLLPFCDRRGIER
jgi:energy-coupling factor transport system permease protein